MNGANGDNVDLVFQRNTNQPATPAASPGVPVEWFATVDDIPQVLISD